MKNIGKKITKLREKKELSQEDFAGELGLSRETISRWENGKALPSSKNLKKVCEVLEIAVEELLNEEQTKDENTKDNNENTRNNKDDILSNELKINLKEDIKKDLRTDLKEDLKTDLRADIKEDLKRDLHTNLREDLNKNLKTNLTDLKINLREDLKLEQDKTNEERKIARVRKARKIILITLICISVIYIGCSIYKFNVLTKIGKEVSKYENLDNYYCEIQTYKNDYIKNKEEIWYKDQKYKIKEVLYNDVGQPVTEKITIMNLKSDFQIIYGNDNTEKAQKIIDKERYKNGSYMYNLFPNEIQNNFKNKMSNALKINLLKTHKIKDKKIYSLRINSLKVELDSKLYTPVLYANIEKNTNSRKYYNIKLNCVEDKDLNV